MENQSVPSSQVPAPQQGAPEQFAASSLPPEITPEVLEAMKAEARQRAIYQVLQQRQEQPAVTFQAQAPSVVYVRRNLTVAELILILALACGLVTGIQAGWGFISNLVPKVEIRVK
jgi:hypothetical protein